MGVSGEVVLDKVVCFFLDEGVVEGEQYSSEDSLLGTGEGYIERVS